MIRFHFRLKLFVTMALMMWLLASGCRVPALTQADEKLPMPSAYDNSADTSNSADLGRKLFYASPHLDALLDTVLKNNYDLKIAMQRIQAAQATVLQSRGMLLPQVNATGSPSLRKFGLYTMDGAGNIVTDIEPGKLVPENLPDYYLGIQTSWEIDVWGKLKNRKKAAVARVLATTEGKNLVQTTLIAETAAAYYELMAEDQVLRVLDETILLQEQAVQTARIQKEAAQVNELAVQQFEAELLSVKSRRIEVLQQIVALENRINFLAGRFPQQVDRDTSFFASQSLPLMKAGIPGALLGNRPDIRQAEWELAATKADLRAARAAFYPAFTISGGFGMQAYRTALLFAFPESIAYSLIGGLTGPILNRRSINAEFSRSSALQQEALLNYQKTVTRGFLEVDQEMKRIRHLDQIYVLKSREKEVLSGSIAVSAELFRTGRANYLEVLITRQNALRSNIELINTRRNQYFSAINLYKALGGGWE
ncbi:TolC family protein [Flavihumibacter fluvii]|uniref:TolC family protein n=1 Tax=Flavihumibacter fluvii TaxID=2838157 RepID=UPI001BDDF421|nr:TolC family protein [Flavihumibacter fluvii]ULQ52076.1 TolC family protein [Flavihumibacter fluvii]